MNEGKSMIYYLLLAIIARATIVQGITTSLQGNSADFEQALVQILREAPANIHSFIILGKNRCNFCLDEVIALLIQSSPLTERKIGIILVGSNNEDAKIQNIIHRGKVRFIAVYGANYERLLRLNARYTSNLRIVARKTVNNNFYLRDAFNDNSASIVDFLIAKK
jgi:hypothetical protein